MRECWVIEEQDKETDAWFGVELYHSEAHAKVKLREWVSEYPHRVVRYVPDEAVARESQAAFHTPQEAK